MDVEAEVFGGDGGLAEADSGVAAAALERRAVDGPAKLDRQRLGGVCRDGETNRRKQNEPCRTPLHH